MRNFCRAWFRFFVSTRADRKWRYVFSETNVNIHRLKIRNGIDVDFHSGDENGVVVYNSSIWTQGFSSRALRVCLQ